MDISQFPEWLKLTVEVVSGLIAVASLITAYTPTPKDDEILKKVIYWISFLKPHNEEGTLKTPFTSPRKKF